MIFIALGSNLGNKAVNLASACNHLSELGTICAKSSILENPAMLLPNSPKEWDIPFKNQVISLLTNLAPHDLLSACQEIEGKMGRTRLSKWAPRIIDIDILWYHGITVNTKELTLPHPGTFNRPFVTPLLLEIAPHMAEKVK